MDEASAAPILDDTERCGIGADHRGMVRFDKDTRRGFRTAMAAIQLYSQDAPQVVKRSWINATEMLNKK